MKSIHIGKKINFLNLKKTRKIKNRTSVFWLNTFFGWSGIGWIALLFYSSLINKDDSISEVEYVKKGKRTKKK